MSPSGIRNRRRVVAAFESRLVRRLVIVPLTVVAALVAVGLSPIIITGTLLVDVVTRTARLRRTRVAALIIGALGIEMIGIIVSLIVWILTGFGLVGTNRWRWHMHRSYMGRYTSALLTLITRVLGTRVNWHDEADLSSGPVVVIARHTSFFDAVIPATLLSRRNKLLAHHVVTQGLRYAPCIDIVGHRFPNRFIKRTPGQGSSELGPISEVGAVLDARSAAIIFPEGTFRNPDRFDRVVRRIRRRQPELADRAEQLNHVLPPRANGTYALVQGAPAADVVVCTNTGFEDFGSLKSIVARPFSERPIEVKTWRIARADIPDDEAGFSEWLFDQYVKVDGWVTERRPSRGASYG